MTTQELVERLRVHIHKQIMHPDVRGDLRVAAKRLSEMDAEIKRLREALRLIANRPTNIPIDPHGMAQFARAALEHQQQKGEGL